MPRRLSTVFVASLLTLSAVGPGSAQPEVPGTVSLPNAGAPVRTPLRIESGWNVTVPLAPGSSVEQQIKQTETARRAIYEMAARECDALRQTFKAECRLQNVRVNSNVQMRNPGNEIVSVNGSGSFELLQR